jgi:hypothetical protein
MANPHRGEHDFVAGSETYRLRFDANAICEAESALGKSIVDISTEIGDGKVSMTVVRGLLYAGLRASHPKVTLLECGRLIEAAGGMFPVYQLIGKAMADAFPAVGGNPTMESGQANGAADGIGLDS